MHPRILCDWTSWTCRHHHLTLVRLPPLGLHLRASSWCLMTHLLYRVHALHTLQPTLRLLLAKEEAPELGVRSWGWEAEHATRRLGLTLCYLIGRGTTNRLLLVSCGYRSQLLLHVAMRDGDGTRRSVEEILIGRDLPWLHLSCVVHRAVLLYLFVVSDNLSNAIDESALVIRNESHEDPLPR